MGKVIGEWQIIETLGEGGQAHVYKVQHVHDESHFGALKRLKNIKRLPRMQAEVDAVNKIDHRGVVKIVSVDLGGSKPYYVTDYVDGLSLDRSIVHDLEVSERLELFDKILRIMKTVHGQSVIHRDLKPANILLTDGLEPKIIDFGLCYIEDGERQTYTDEVVGSRWYTPPEYEGGRHDDIRPSADVYSLGKVLYWLLTVIHLPRESYLDEKYDVGKSTGIAKTKMFDRLFSKTIAENPADRYPTAAAFLSDFSAVAKNYSQAINLPKRSVEQRCIYCGIGKYHDNYQKDSEDDTRISSVTLKNDFGISMVSGMRPRPLICSVCGNVQWFDLKFMERYDWEQ